MGILFSILAGAAMSLQGVFNTRLSEKIGLFESNAYVQGTAFALSLVALLIAGNGNLARFAETDLISRLGGALGLAITVFVMLSIRSLSPAVAISIILVAQLLVAGIIDAFGLFGQQRLPFGWRQYVGGAVLIGGVLLFKWR